MKAINYIRKSGALLLAVGAMTCASCSDWLDIEPDGQATKTKLTETGDGYRTMLSGIYKDMTNANLYGRELQFGLTDCLSQQYTWNWFNGANTTSPTVYQEAKNFNYRQVALRKLIDDVWKQGYNVIANANSLIDDVQRESPDKFDDKEMEQKLILGEAYACRALMHFDLLRLFAPAPIEQEKGLYLPYVETYPNIQPNAIDTKAFLDKVVADLLKAQELTAAFDTTALGQSMNAGAECRFEDSFKYGMEGAANPNLIDDFYKGRGYRLNYYAIHALLARVYQYMGNDEKAFEYAEKVMTFKAAGLPGTNVSYDMFTADDWYKIMEGGEDMNQKSDLRITSNIIAALYNENAYDEYQLNDFFKKQDESMGNSRWLVLDVEGQEMFKTVAEGNNEFAEDYRATQQLWKPDFYAFGDDRYRLSGKYYASTDLPRRKKNLQTIPLIRATEMRYIMAEHYARTGNFDEAYNLLNGIRQNRGLWTPLPTQTTVEAFLKDLVRDAQREYIGEGQLFFLYKRLGFPVKVGNQTRKLTKAEYMLPIPDNQNN